jgi:hypothetical protein
MLGAPSRSSLTQASATQPRDARRRPCCRAQARTSRKPARSRSSSRRSRPARHATGPSAYSQRWRALGSGLLGGVLVQAVSWRWAFFVTCPSPHLSPPSHHTTSHGPGASPCPARQPQPTRSASLDPDRVTGRSPPLCGRHSRRPGPSDRWLGRFLAGGLDILPVRPIWIGRATYKKAAQTVRCERGARRVRGCSGVVGDPPP